MFNNFTGENLYQSCNLIIPEKQERGAILLGDFNSAVDEEVINKNKIKTIITAGMGLQNLQIPSSVTQIVYPLKDSKTQNILVYFDECYKTIEKKIQLGGILVHCSAGVSRSATLVIAYLMKKNQLTFKSAIKYVKSRRSGVCPNLGFELQLKQYEKVLFGDVNISITKKKIEKKKETRHNFSQQSPFQSDKKQIQNQSTFNFEPIGSKNYNFKKIQARKTATIAYNFRQSRPKANSINEVNESQLFITGKSAKRPYSHVKKQLLLQRFKEGK